MRTRPGARSVRLLGALALLAASTAGAADSRGAMLYRRHCAGCHGPEGRGDGPDAALLDERPRDLQDGVLHRYDTAALVRRIRQGTPLALTRDRGALDRWLRDTDALTDHLERLARTGPRLAAEGRRAWEARCERCHGPFGAPPPDLPNESPDDLGDPAVQRRYDDDRLREAVRHGVPGMPALDQPVPATEVAPLVAYVRMLGPGMVIYEHTCASCHGDDGRPVDLPPGLRRPVVTFDATWLAGTARQERETAVWHMLANERPQMPHLAPTLGAPDVTLIVEWLRSRTR